MPNRDDDFTDSVKREIENRAGGRCSNPECRAPTKGPKSEATGTISVGEAAHIEGAQPGSARYNPSLSSEERKSIGNAIWVCVTCHTIIDRDAVGYPVPLLREWRRGVEAEASASLGKPNGISREAFVNRKYGDLLDTARHIGEARTYLENDSSGLTQREKAELYERYHIMKCGANSEYNPFKQICQACKSQFFGSELQPKEVTVSRYYLAVGDEIPAKNVVKKVQVCQLCAAPQNWRLVEKRFQQEIIDKHNQTPRRWHGE